MGRNGQTLRSMEEEWGVLMFFAKIGGGREAERESLCIFGSLPSRRGAEVKVMSAIEHKNPGSCVSSKGDIKIFDRVKGDEDEGGWGVDTMPLSEENFSYALGSQGSTRKKLAAASGCIIEYVGHLACFCGYKKDRRRGKDYLRWLIEQRTGNSVVEKPHDRDDCLVFKIPTSSIACVGSPRGRSRASDAVALASSRATAARRCVASSASRRRFASPTETATRGPRSSRTSSSSRERPAVDLDLAAVGPTDMRPPLPLSPLARARPRRTTAARARSALSLAGDLRHPL
jgi:hypothetical protein